MSDVIKTIKADGLTIEISASMDGIESPRENDGNICKMICFHKNYNLGDKHDYNQRDYSNWKEMEAAIRKTEKDVVHVASLYLYDHSGITISTTPFNCPWDSGQVGLAIITKRLIRDCFGLKQVSLRHIKKAIVSMESEIKEYDLYLRGEVYEYVVYDIHGDAIESMSGLMGIEYAEEAAMLAVSYLKKTA